MISLLRPNYVPGDNSTPLLLFTQNLTAFTLISYHFFPPDLLLLSYPPPPTHTFSPYPRLFLSLSQVIDTQFLFFQQEQHTFTDSFPPSALVCVVSKSEREADKLQKTAWDLLILGSNRDEAKTKSEREREREKWFPLHWSSPPLIVHQSLAISLLQIEVKGTRFYLSLKTE